MCFFDQHKFICSHWKWGQFRQHCTKEFRMGETCGMKLVMQTIQDEKKCNPCQKQEVKALLRLQRRHRRQDGQRSTDNLRFRFYASPSVAARASYGLDPYDYEDEPQTLCSSHNCPLAFGHDEPHQSIAFCCEAGCTLSADHSGPHWPIPTSRAVAGKIEVQRKGILQKHQEVDRLVLIALGSSHLDGQASHCEASPESVIGQTYATDLSNYSSNNIAFHVKSVYPALNLGSKEVRLFQLFPSTQPANIRGTFLRCELGGQKEYTAVSYTWGDQRPSRKIDTGSGTSMWVRDNLYQFLQQQSASLSRPKLFWIDAICIDQSNVNERNHQVNLMKDIYASASTVYVWLGEEANNSRLAMDYLARSGFRQLRRKGPGYKDFWSRTEGEALYDLCERPYWRRMWIIQEVIHARNIVVWCGAKSINWSKLQDMYSTLNEVMESSWFAHHKFAISVFQSSAAVMVWQRAHWRHPKTAKPNLQTLIQTFCDWKCADPRDKVYALVSMASNESAVIPDYALSTCQIYLAVQADPPFNELLARTLGLGVLDRALLHALSEHKLPQPEKLLFKRKDDQNPALVRTV